MCKDGEYSMKDSLSIIEWYLPGIKRDKKTESQHLKTFAKKITKAPDFIHIPREYLTSFGVEND